MSYDMDLPLDIPSVTPPKTLLEKVKEKHGITTDQEPYDLWTAWIWIDPCLSFSADTEEDAVYGLCEKLGLKNGKELWT